MWIVEEYDVKLFYSVLCLFVHLSFLFTVLLPVAIMAIVNCNQYFHMAVRSLQEENVDILFACFTTNISKHYGGEQLVQELIQV